MRKLIKANTSRKDSVEAYACGCSCTCACTTTKVKVNQASSKYVSKAQSTGVNYK